MNIILIASAVVLGIVGFLVGIQYRKNIAEKAIGSAENRAKIIIKDAEKEAQAKKKEILVEAKEEIQRNRNEAEKELKDLINTNPKNIEYTICLANIYLKEKKYLKARKVLKDFVKNNPDQKGNPRFEAYGFLKIGL